MNVTRRYQLKLYPTPEQAAVLHEQRKMMGDLWNALKQRCEDVYRREGRALRYFDLTSEITELRHECPEWAEIPAITAHRVAKWLVDSYQAFFRRLRSGEAPGYPAWRARSRSRTIPLGTMDKTGWRAEQRHDNPLSWRLHYKSITDVKDRATWIHARGKLPRNLDGDPAWIDEYRNGDIIYRDGQWWLSICVDIEARRRPGRRPMTVEFDLLSGIARVNGRLEDADDLHDLNILSDDLDRLKSTRDERFPRGTRPSDEEQAEFVEISREIARVSAYIARRRKDFLHVWTARVVARASDLTIIAPAKIKDVTKTPRGNSKSWGANVGAVSTLNRHILGMAPYTATQMLKYKAAEAGIRCDIIADAAPPVAVGGELVSVGKQLRRARREVRRRAA